MSEMQGQTVMAAGTREKDTSTPSYVSLYDGPPDSWPEVAREITMLLGQAEVVLTKMRHVEESFGILRDHLAPVMSDRPRPEGAEIRPADSGAPPVTSPIAHDLRKIGRMLRNAEDDLVAFEARIARVNSEVTL